MRPCLQRLYDGTALRSLKMIFENLPRAYENGENDPVAREKMGNAATMAGRHLPTRFSAYATAWRTARILYHIPHGVANALMIDEVIRNARTFP